MGGRLPQALAIAEQISRYGGLFLVLTHPNVLDHKLAFTQGLVEQLKPSAWYGSLARFGQWWVARDQVMLDVTDTSAAGQPAKSVRLQVPQTLSGLALDLPERWQLLDAQPASARPVRVGRQWVLPAISGEVVLRYTP